MTVAVPLLGHSDRRDYLVSCGADLVDLDAPSRGGWPIVGCENLLFLALVGRLDTVWLVLGGVVRAVLGTVVPVALGTVVPVALGTVVPVALGTVVPVALGTVVPVALGVIVRVSLGVMVGVALGAVDGLGPGVTDELGWALVVALRPLVGTVLVGEVADGDAGADVPVGRGVVLLGGRW